MLEKFTTEPFHNLRLLVGPEKGACLSGGTCSEKTLSFVKSARNSGFDAHLHSAFIGEREIHRLARIVIDGHDFFADIGNGWPAIKLYQFWLLVNSAQRTRDIGIGKSGHNG